MDQPAGLVDDLHHPVGVDQQLLDHARQARQREVQRDGRIRPDVALDRRMADVALVPQRHVLHRRQRHRPDQPGQPRQVLGQHGLRLCGIALDPFWPGEKYSSASRNFGPLHVPDLGRQALDRRGDNRQHREEHRVAVARDDLGRDTARPPAPSPAPHAPRPPGRYWRTCRQRPRSRRSRPRPAPPPAGRGCGRTLHRPAPASARTSWVRHGSRGSARWSPCPCARMPASSGRPAAHPCPPAGCPPPAPVAR